MRGERRNESVVSEDVTFNNLESSVEVNIKLLETKVSYPIIKYLIKSIILDFKNNSTEYKLHKHHKQSQHTSTVLYTA